MKIEPLAALRTIMSPALDGLDATKRLVLVALVIHAANKTGECFPSHDLLAVETSLGRRTIIRAIKGLVAAGYVRQRTIIVSKGDGRRGPRNLYELVLPVEQPRAPVRVDRHQPQPEHDATPARCNPSTVPEDGGARCQIEPEHGDVVAPELPKGTAEGTTHEDLAREVPALVLDPSDSKPEPKPATRRTSRPREAKKTGCPPADAPPEVLNAWLAGWGLTRSPDLEHFLDHHRAKGNLFADWAAAWRTWQRNGREFGRPARRAANDFVDRRGVARQGHGGVDKYIPEGL